MKTKRIFLFSALVAAALIWNSNLVHAQDAPAVPTVEPEAEAAPETPASGGGLTSAMANNGPLSFVLEQVQTDTGDKITVRSPAVSQTNVTILMENVTTEQVLDYLASNYGWVWLQRDDGTYELMDQETYRTQVLPEQVIRKVFRPQYRTSREVLDLFTQMATPQIGSVAEDPTTGKVIVVDLPDRIAAMQELLDEIDIPLVTRIFDIRYANPEDVADALGELMTPDVGNVRIDPRTRQIIVRDQFNVIKQMELLVMTLDKAPEVRAYDVNTIGIEGETFEQLVEKILTIVTAEENVQTDPVQGRIMVEDIPEVHERIERLLRVFDRPQRQIMLLAEIIEADLDRTLEFTSQIEIAGDMESAINNGLAALFGNGDDTGSQTGGFNFANLEDALPVASLGGGGITVSNLGKHYAAQLSSLLSDSDTKVLLKPRLLVANQQEAIIHVGRNEPIPTVFANDNNLNNTYYQSTQQTVTTGLEVNVTPSITSTGMVEMDVFLTNSEPFRVPVRNAQGNIQDLLGTTEQSVETQLIIPSGETRVISGLNRKQNSETKSGIPVLRQIPFIGPVFGSYRKTAQDRSLLFFLTPIIVEEQPREEFLKSTQLPYVDLVAAEPAEKELVLESTEISEAMKADLPERLVYEGETGPFAGIDVDSTPDVILSSQPPDAVFNGSTSTARRGAIPGPKGTIAPSGAGAQVVRSTPTEGAAPIITSIPDVVLGGDVPVPPAASPTPAPTATPAEDAGYSGYGRRGRRTPQSPTPTPTPAPSPTPEG